MPADVLEVDIDAVGHRRTQLRGKIVGAVIQRHIEAQRLQIRALLLATGNAHRARALQLGDLPHCCAHRATGGSHHDRFARLRLADFLQTHIGGKSGHAVHTQGGTDRQAIVLKLAAELVAMDDRVRLPVARSQHMLADGETGMVGGKHFSNGAPFHHRVQRNRCGVGRPLLHATAHVGIQRQIAIAQQHLARARRGNRHVLDTEVGRDGSTVGARGEDDAGVGERGHQWIAPGRRKRNPDSTPSRHVRAGGKTAFHGCRTTRLCNHHVRQGPIIPMASQHSIRTLHRACVARAAGQGA
ncbi:hypothetical protein D3C71_1325990 [compost metagenome]